MTVSTEVAAVGCQTQPVLGAMVATLATLATDTRAAFAGNHRARGERLRPLLDQNAAILITPNHPSHADRYALYEAAEVLGRPFYFMTAWQVLFSYPGDYVKARPTMERVAETLDKFEEDVLGYQTARIRGTRRAIVEFGEPIDVRQFAEGMTQPRKAARPLTNASERAVQALLDGDVQEPIHAVAAGDASPVGVPELQAN